MKFVNFKTLTIANFLSIGREPVKVDFKQGINIITGVNKDMKDRRNGVGKTTIADAFFFAVFGNTIREIKKDLIVNDITNDTAITTLTFALKSVGVEDNYKIVRTLNPSKCYLYKNGIDITRDSIANTNETICDIIDANQDIFKNCVIMTINGMVPFMAQTKVEKRKFIEGIFDLQVFSKMLSHVRDEYSDNKKLYDIELLKLNEMTTNLTNTERKRDAILAERKSKLAELNQTILQKQQEREQIKTIINNRDQLKESLKEATSKVERLQKSMDVKQEKYTNEVQKAAIISTQISNIDNTIKAIGVDGSNCIKCLKRVTHEDHEYIAAEKQRLNEQKAELSAQLVEIQAIRNKLQEERENIKAAIKMLQQKSKLLNTQIQAQEQSIIDINTIDTYLSTVNTYAKSLEDVKTDVDDIISESKPRIITCEQQVLKQLETVNLLDTMKIIVSEEGVKTYIIKRTLKALNGRMQHYLDKIGFKCICKFNECFEEEIINDRGKLCSYFSFSGAERKSIDLACLFTFIDIRRVQGNVAYNVVFYDEVLDTSIDADGVETLCKIIEERAHTYNECAYIITHRSEVEFFNEPNTIFLEKSNGITKRVDYST